MENIQELKEENIELKKILAVYMNKRLIKKLSEAINRINKGEYVSEKEFFKDSPQEAV